MRRGVYIILLLVVSRLGFGQGVPEYFLTCDPDSFAVLYADPWTDRTISATLTHNGQTWNRVRLRIRGDSSRGFKKKSLKLKTDGDLFPDGRDALNFNADYIDPSYLRSVLASHLMQASGQPAFTASHVRLYLNGAFLGLYVLVENMDTDFLRARTLDPDGNLYKATRDNASMSRYDRVEKLWEKKTNESGSWDDLKALIQALHVVPDSAYLDFARRTFDYELMVNMIAMNMLIANGSTYYHNYYLYHDRNRSELWTMMPWDLDRIMAYYGVAYPYNRSGGPGNPDNPFLERAILNETIFRDIRTRVDELAATLFNEAYLFPMIDSLQTLLAASVLEDTTDQVPDRATWDQAITLEKQYIQNRHRFLTDQFERFPRPFRIQRRAEAGPSGLTFRWNRSVSPDGSPLTYRFRYGTDRFFPDSTSTAFENLTDTTFTLTSLPPPGTYFWKVSAVNSVTSVSGFDTWNEFTVPALASGPITITEINHSPALPFDTGDWIELHNAHSAAVDLSRWTVWDERDDHVFILPEGTRIGPGGYLVVSRDTAAFRQVYPDVQPVIGDVSFGWSAADAVRVFNAFGGAVDAVDYTDESAWPVVEEGYTLALGEQWTLSRETGGTPGRANTTQPIGTEGASEIQVSRLMGPYPNPFMGHTVIGYDLDRSASVTLRVYDVAGRLVRQMEEGQQQAGSYRIRWDASGLGAGVYLIELNLDGKPFQVRRSIVVNN